MMICGRQLHGQSLKFGCACFSFVSNSLISMYMKFGCHEDALLAYSGASECNLVTYNALIKGFAENYQPLIALDLFKHLCQQGLVPDQFSFMGVLCICENPEFLNLKLKQVRKVLRKWNWEVFGNIKKKMKSLITKIEMLENSLQQSWDSEVEKSIQNCKMELEDLMQQDHILVKERTRFNWLKEGDCSSSFFHAAVKARSISIRYVLTCNLLSDVGGDTLDSNYGFIVEYGPDIDAHSDFHVDESEVTLNVCLGDEFRGGNLYFRGIRCAKHLESNMLPEANVSILQVPGSAVLHRGRHRHGAQGVTSGYRSNFVLWCRSSVFREMEKHRKELGGSGWCGECQAEKKQRLYSALVAAKKELISTETQPGA